MDAQGHTRTNAAALQRALGPQQYGGRTLEKDGYKLCSIGKREAHRSAVVPMQKIVRSLAW